MSRSLCLWVALAACSPSPSDLPPAPSAQPDDATPPVGPTADNAPPQKTWTVTFVQAGDIACYVDLTDSEGAVTTYLSDFELCPGGSHDATALLGRAVNATFVTHSVQAASCQGDPECSDSQQVEGIATLTPAG